MRNTNTILSILFVTALWAGAPSVHGSTVPGSPTGVTTTVGNSYLLVTFLAPSDSGGAAVTSYTAIAKPGNITATGSGSPLVLTGLTNGTKYTVTLFASNSFGNSEPSAPSDTAVPNTPQPPVVQYDSSSYSETLGSAVVHTPLITGTVTSCQSYPTLPIGLRINTTTCVISGTPRLVTARSNYSIVASNGTASTVVTLSLAVDPVGGVSVRPRSTTSRAQASQTPSLPSGRGVDGRKAPFHGYFLLK